MTHNNQVLGETEVTYEIRELLEEIYGMEKAAESFDRWHDLSEEMVEYGDPLHDRSRNSPRWLLERVEYLSSLLVLPGEEQVSENLFKVAQRYKRSTSFGAGISCMDCVLDVKRRLEEALEDLLGGGVDPLGGGVDPDSVKNGKLPRKQPGRKKADYETVKSEGKMAAEWERMKAAGVSKVEFAKEKNIPFPKLNNLLDRVRKRNHHSEN